MVLGCWIFSSGKTIFLWLWNSYMKGSWLHSIILVMKSLLRHEMAMGCLWRRYENTLKWWTFLWIVHGYFIDNPVSSVTQYHRCNNHTVLLTWDVRWDKYTTWFVQSWKGLELMTYNYNLDSAFQTLWMEVQFAKKTNAFNFVKSCINYITLLSTSNITLMKPLRNKSLPIS